MWADVSVTPARILVPTILQRVVFDSLHCIAHPGVKAGMALIQRTYWWQGIGKDVARWTKSCEACQKAKVHKHTKAPLERLPAPTKRFSHIPVGELKPACEGKNTLLTVIDRWTGWPEAFPMTMHGDAANTKACAKVLVRQRITRWGVPDIITSDCGSQFASDLWLEATSIRYGFPFPSGQMEWRFTGECFACTMLVQWRMSTVLRGEPFCFRVTTIR